MAPALQEVIRHFGALVGCSLLSGLLMQLYMELLALMGSANKVPICFAGYDASDIAWVVLVPGLTGIAITSRRSHNPH